MAEIIVEGLEQLEQLRADLIRAGRTDTLTGNMTLAIQAVEGAAKIHCPVDTGLLRASITSEVRSTDSEVRAITGPSKFYGAYVHFGTRPHWPPPGALAGWAARHGTTDYLVRRAIGRRGTKPRPYLWEGFEDMKGTIERYLDLSLEAKVRIVVDT